MPYNRSIVGWMPVAELEVIEKLAQLPPENGHILEIGALAGRSSVCFAMSCKPGVTVTCVDLFDTHTVNHGLSDEAVAINNFPIRGQSYDLYKEFTNNTKELSNIRMIRGNSPAGINYDGTHIDLLFIDAEHRNPSDWNNIVFYSQFMSVGGYISGHDYNKPTQFPDIIENVTRLERIFNTKVITFESSSIWLIPITAKVNLNEL